MANQSDCTNDLGGAHDPEFTGVAVCLGSDTDGCPVTLVDRLCLNRPAVEVMLDNMSICQQEANAYKTTAQVLDKKLSNETARANFWLADASFLSIVAIILCAILHKKQLESSRKS